MTEIESLKKQVKDLQDTMDGKLAAIDKQIKATDRAQVLPQPRVASYDLV